MDDIFIVEIENALSPELCNEIIEKFEQDEGKEPGVTGYGTVTDIKKSTDLFISSKPEWHEINDLLIKNFCDNYKNVYNEKMEKLPGSNQWWILSTMTSLDHTGKQIKFIRDGIRDMINTITGFQIQRTKKGEHYHWHTDELRKEQRYLTYIYYLNTLDEEDGGYTEFISGKKIKPEQGKLLIFPATWTYVHRGNPVLGKTKYIITGWFKNAELRTDVPTINL
jgi:hypothetical protein